MKPIDLAVETKTRPWPLRVLNLAAKIALPLVVLAGAYTIFQDFKAGRPEVPQRPARERVWTVETMPAEFRRIQPQLKLYGAIQAGRDIALRALVAGEIVEIAPDLRVGALVEAGTPLIRIDPFSYEGQVIEAQAERLEADARLREIEASIAADRDALANEDEQLTLASRDLERARDLVNRGSLSERSVDDRRLVVSQREQAVQQRRNSLAMNEARADQQRAAITRYGRRIEQAERDLNNTTLKAPFTGYVDAVSAQVGRVVNSNDVVVDLTDRSEIEVGFTLSDRQYGRIVAARGDVIGRPVTINWYVGDDPLTFSGRIARLAPEIAAASGGVKMIAVLDRTDRTDIVRPGAFVEVLVPDRAYDSVVQLPETALYPGDQVFVVKDQRLEPRQIDIVGFDGSDILVRGALEAGERIVTTRIAVAGQGLKVKDLSTAETGDGENVSGRPKGPGGAGKGKRGPRGQDAGAG